MTRALPGQGLLKLHDFPLGFLPAFEAAGRLGSFAAAAAELHVTPSAISQQIRALESTLGVVLFARSGRAAVLTQAGHTYLRDVTRALQELANSTARVRRQTRESVLRLHTTALAAHEFLLPRLPEFRAVFPEIELRIETSNDVVDFRVVDCDAAIRLGTGWPELKVYPLGTAELAVVCAPQLAARIRDLADVADYTLLDPLGDVQRGLAMMMHAHAVPARPLKVWRFETCQESMRAAESGVGVTLAVFPVATPWITSGRLSVPLPLRLAMPGNVCMVHRPEDEGRFPFAQLAAWFEAQYQALPQLPAGRIVDRQFAAAE